MSKMAVWKRPTKQRWACDFVERDVPAPEHGEGISRKVRILQQMFVPKNWHTHDMEWRDVPLSEV